MSEASEAFVALVDMAVVCRANARALPSQEQQKAYWTGIGISIHKRLYVCPLGEISEILKLPACTKLPGVGGWVNGVANVRGKLLPLLDMNLFFFGDKSALVQSRRRVLVLDEGDMYTGLIVDNVMGMQHFPKDGFRENVEAVIEPMRPFVDGCYRRGEENWHVFRPKRLLKDTRFMKLAG